MLGVVRTSRHSYSSLRQLGCESPTLQILACLTPAYVRRRDHPDHSGSLVSETARAPRRSDVCVLGSFVQYIHAAAVRGGHTSLIAGKKARALECSPPRACTDTSCACRDVVARLECQRVRAASRKAGTLGTWLFLERHGALLRLGGPTPQCQARRSDNGSGWGGCITRNPTQRRSAVYQCGLKAIAFEIRVRGGQQRASSTSRHIPSLIHGVISTTWRSMRTFLSTTVSKYCAGA